MNQVHESLNCFVDLAFTQITGNGTVLSNATLYLSTSVFFLIPGQALLRDEMQTIN